MIAQADPLSKHVKDGVENDGPVTKEKKRKQDNRAVLKGNTMMLWTLRKLVALSIIVLRLSAFIGMHFHF